MSPLPKDNRLSVEQVAARLTAGVARLAPDAVQRIQSFLREYLGSTEQSVPFGGRDAELAALDAWLADEHAPPYALVAAGAGRGKSALLVQWAARLLERDAVEVLFLPISIRFNTALATATFTTLAARLGELYDEPLQWADLPAAHWREVAQRLMSRPLPHGKPLVVILDGLDEAADWQAGPELFPSQPVPGLRVVVAARLLAGDTNAQGWLERLDWAQGGQARTFSLALLTQAGVEALLAAMGHPLDTLAAHGALLAELYRLSEGEPLLVRLYIDALQRQGEQVAFLTSGDLATLQPGLAGYFERWWTEQQALWGTAAPRHALMVETLLALLAGTLGPIEHATLLLLAPPEINLTDSHVARALHVLRRFIVGDGVNLGYTFSHPRLGYFFWERLAPEARAAWEARFLAVGRAVVAALNDGRLAPQEAPPYIVQYYGAHLTRAHAPLAEVAALVSEGWLRAWEALEGTHSGFLGDVARAWQQAEQAFIAAESPPSLSRSACLALQVHCALCQASVVALSANIPEELLVEAVAGGVLSPLQAQVIIQQLPKEEERVRLLLALLPALPTAQQEAGIQEGLARVRALGDNSLRAELLRKLALYLLPPEREAVLQEALMALRMVQDEWARARLLQELVPHVPPARIIDLFAEAQGFQQEYNRARALGTLVPYLPPAQHLELLAEALALQEHAERAHLLTALLPYLPAQAYAEAREAALLCVQMLHAEGDPALVLHELTPHLPPALQSAVLRESLTITRALPTNQRGAALQALAPYLSEALLAEALTIAEDPNTWHDGALHGLAPYLPPALLDRALTFARTLRHDDERARALAALIPYLPMAQQAEALQDVLAAALDIVLLRPLAPYLSPALLAEVLAATYRLEDAPHRAAVLTVLVPHLPPEQRAPVLRAALLAARALQDTEGRVEALADLVADLPTARQRRAMEGVLREAQALHAWRYTFTLRKVAPHLPPDLLGQALAVDTSRPHHELWYVLALGVLLPYLSPPLLAEALATVRTIEEPSLKADMLTSLLPHLPPEEQEGVCQDALVAARAIRTDTSRVSALRALLPYLAEAERATVLREALSSARALPKKEECIRALEDLIPHLPPEGQAEALEELLLLGPTLRDGEAWVALLDRMLPHLPATLLSEILAVSRSLLQALEQALEGKLEHLPPGLRRHMSRNEMERITVATLRALAPHLPPPSLIEALTLARNLPSPAICAAALTTLLPHLPPTVQAAVSEEILLAVQTISYPAHRVEALCWLAHHLPPEAQAAARREARAIAVAIPNDFERTSTLEVLVHALPKEEQVLMLQGVSRVDLVFPLEPSCRAALHALAQHLPPELLALALGTRQHAPTGWPISGLTTLTPHLVDWARYSPQACYPAWCAALRALARFPRPRYVLRDLSALLPVALALAEEERAESAHGFFQAIQAVGRWWP